MAQKTTSPWVSGLLVLVVISLVLGALWVSRPDPPTPIAPEPAPAPVHTRVVQAQPRSEFTTVFGLTQAMRRAQLDSEQSGLITWRSPDLEVGATIAADEVLIRLDVGRLEQHVKVAEAALLVAQAQIGVGERQRDAAIAEAQSLREVEPLAERERDRQDELFQSGDGAEALRDQAELDWIEVQGKREVALATVRIREAAIEAARAQVVQAEASLAQAQDELARGEIRAPFDATVAHVHVEQGGFVAPGAPICQLVDIEELRVVVQVPTESSVRADLEQVMEVRFPAILGDDGQAMTREASAFAFAPEASATSRSRAFELRMTNAGGQLPIGAFVELDLPLGERTAVWLRPNEFRLDDAGARAVVVEDGRARLAALKLGQALIDADGLAWHPVLEGLQGGEVIAIDNLESVDDGAELLLMDSDAATSQQ